MFTAFAEIQRALQLCACSECIQSWVWLTARPGVRPFSALRVSSKASRVLQSVRVVQRNLVYVVGLAMDICYEDVLRGSEFFGQFGKPIKVRHATGFALSAHHVTWDAHPLHIHASEMVKAGALQILFISEHDGCS